MPKGEEVSVLYVQASEAKRWKTQLTQQGLLHPRVRMHPVPDGRIAIPVIEEKKKVSSLLLFANVESGRCFCPYRSAILGNSTPDPKAIQQILIDFLQTAMMIPVDLSTILPTCPHHPLELMGDDRTVVIPANMWDPIELSSYIQRHAPSTTDISYDSLWQRLAALYSSRRIVRRGTIDPNNKVRHSTFSVVWHDGSYPKEGWMTITEQGIRQSLDITKLMFSRGNITEKIRFGQTLVQKGEEVLDLYAGIGYFTLPALVHGQAKHVVACEWNPEAVHALHFNLKDNQVHDRATVLEGDCRHAPWCHQRFDRVSLGLLPSSQGGWKTAVRALKEDCGGWLHVHANVPATERDVWGNWLCTQLLSHAPTSWMVILHHLQKVKSFAPTVHHYVADVCIGPPEIVTQRTGCPVEEVRPGIAFYRGVIVEKDVPIPFVCLVGNGCIASRMDAGIGR
ncbi:tRNA wybutosine-synthesizing protein 2 [Fistulifera solaris]|uniref:tRNA wybutosine-synthesizing protein 2 n=1 Tax=Fistulifera solaris TaxID=1519565 RepID=A0A1Z5J8H8_FISSO|nr:tRNA wybutosine-synthesizing protein 2 [Fistulifera solaris]|eukprot:GAX10300.1 tRNA wybutosine-synthesizing protein 2 [Fistulifera solaris]